METVQELRNALREVTAELERIEQSPAQIATVLMLDGDDVLVASTRGTFVIKQVAGRRAAKMVPGDSVLVLPETMQMLRHNGLARAHYLGAVTEIIGGRAIVNVQGQDKLVYYTGDLELGQRVLMDEFNSYVVESIKQPATEFIARDTGVSWDDIGGQEQAKYALREAIEFPTTQRELYQFYGKEPVNGVLLYGPPGCGKTMLAKASATALGSLEGFIFCKGPEVLDPYVGVAEAKVRSLFKRARAYHNDTGNRAIIFIDEAEAILGRRDGRYNMMEKTIVPQFLSEMDGMDEKHATVILATNRADALDAAVVRDGRIDRKIKVDRPCMTASAQIVGNLLRKAPVNGDAEELTNLTVAQVFRQGFIHQATSRELPMERFVSGAMLAGVVEKAKSWAMQRDMAEGTLSGIHQMDLERAVHVAADEMGAVALEVL